MGIIDSAINLVHDHGKLGMILLLLEASLGRWAATSSFTSLVNVTVSVPI